VGQHEGDEGSVDLGAVLLLLLLWKLGWVKRKGVRGVRGGSMGVCGEVLRWLRILFGSLCYGETSWPEHGN